jgi:bifunctional DNA-binding transcriptional regulator/antitoxin component of YhaV-PrlF toxin-antitoxin module
MEPITEFETYTAQIKADGTLELPETYRSELKLEAGDPVTIIRVNGHLIISPRPLVVPEMTEKIAGFREQAGLTIDDLVAGLETVGQQLYEEQYGRPTTA